MEYSFLTLDFNVFTVIFILLIFWGLEIKLRRIQRNIEDIKQKLDK